VDQSRLRFHAVSTVTSSLVSDRWVVDRHCDEVRLLSQELFETVETSSFTAVYVKSYARRLNVKDIHGFALAIVQDSIVEGNPYNMVMVESNMAQEYCAENIHMRMENAGIRIRLDRHFTESNATKEIRIRNDLTYDLEAGRIKLVHRKHCPDNAMMYNQLQGFPSSNKYDDLIDALSICFQGIWALKNGAKRRPMPPTRLTV